MCSLQGVGKCSAVSRTRRGRGGRKGAKQKERNGGRGKDAGSRGSAAEKEIELVWRKRQNKEEALIRTREEGD